MFGALKDKLKNWLSKNKQVEKEEKSPKKKEKKEKIKKETKKKKEKKTDEKNVIQEIAPSFVKEVEIIQKEQEIKDEKEKKSLFSFFKRELTKERFDEMFDELEMILLQNNVASLAVNSIKSDLEKKLVGKNLKDVDLSKELKESIISLLINPPNFVNDIKKAVKEKSPFVILFAGINGSGKTTTIAKVANLLLKNNFSVCLAAADTFRAASIEQIQQHADKLGVHLIKKEYGSDPASVGFDAISYAKKHHIDVVLIDTAGRMQNRDSLMREMEKIVRVNKPDMRIFLGESITGNDATEQAKTFNDTINLTGIILSKADVDEKGGTAISVSYVTGKPILFLGTGQSYDDLEVFDKDKLVERMGL